MGGRAVISAHGPPPRACPRACTTPVVSQTVNSRLIDQDQSQPAERIGRSVRARPSRRGRHPRLRGTRGWRTRRRARLAIRRTWFARRPLSTIGLALLVLLTPLWWSFGSAVTNPANGSPVAAAAEWVRGHGGSSVVRWAENLWYSHHAPPVGGRPPAGAIPLPSGGRIGGGSGRVAHLPMPPSIVPLASPAVPGEGQWHPAGRLVHGVPAVYEAFLRPDPVHTSLVVGVAWMDPTLLSATLYSGSVIPGGGPWHFTAPVTPSAALDLVAGFNSGFRMPDAEGGYYAEGHSVLPLVPGDASLVFYADGRVTVAKWGRDATMGPGVTAVRQNLHLLVDHGAPVPGLQANDTTQWGLTLGNHVFVWRSGAGVTQNGALVYVGGPGLNITTLADLLVRVGAVRGMELDINTDWVKLSAYSPPSGQLASAANGAPLLSSMVGGAGRYFTDWPRDFVTMSARP